MEIWTVDSKLPGDLIPSLWFFNWYPEELLMPTAAAELVWIMPMPRGGEGQLSELFGTGRAEEHS